MYVFLNSVEEYEKKKKKKWRKIVHVIIIEYVWTCLNVPK